MSYWGKTTDERFQTSPNTRERNREKRLHVRRFRNKELQSSRRSSFSPLQNKDKKVRRSLSEEIRRTEARIAGKRSKILRLQKERADLVKLQENADKLNRDLQARVLRARSTIASKTTAAIEYEQLTKERQAAVAAFGRKSKELAEQLVEYQKEAAMGIH